MKLTIAPADDSNLVCVGESKLRGFRPEFPCFRELCTNSGKISGLEMLLGTRGWLEVSMLNVETIEHQDALIYSDCVENNGALKILDEDLCRKLLLLPARVAQCADISGVSEKIRQSREELVGEKSKMMQQESEKLFLEEKSKQIAWRDDCTKELEEKIYRVWREVEVARSRATWSAEKRWKKTHKELKEKLNAVCREQDERIREIESRCRNFKSQTIPLFLNSMDD